MEDKIKAELWNNGKSYLVRHKDEEIVLHRSPTFENMLYTKCLGCGRIISMFMSREGQDTMVRRDMIEIAIEHRHTCPGLEAVNRLDELFGMVTQNKAWEVLLVKEIVKALYAIAGAISLCD